MTVGEVSSLSCYHAYSDSSGGAQWDLLPNGECTWTSSDPGVVSVGANTGVVTAVAAGDAVINVSWNKDPAVPTGSMRVSVSAPETTTAAPETEPSPVTLGPVSADTKTPGISFRKTTGFTGMSLPAVAAVGTQKQYEVYSGFYSSMFGPNYTTSVPVSECVWSSSDPSIATVENGLATFLAAGQVTITCTWNGLTTSESVTVQ